MLPTIASAVGGFINNLVPMAHQSYTAPISTPPPTPVIPGVPARYAQDVSDVVSHTGLGTSTIAGMLSNENGGNWSPTLRGTANSADYGPAQLNTSPTGAVAQLNKTPFFQNAYSHPFNYQNPDDNIHGMGVYLNYIRQYLLPSQGIKNPTDEQVISAYNSIKPAQGQKYLNKVQQHIRSLPFSAPIAQQ